MGMDSAGPSEPDRPTVSTASSSDEATPGVGSRTKAALVVLAVLTVAALSGGLVLSTGAQAATRALGLGPQGRQAQFKVECGFSHAAADDPIVHFGHAGASHLHDFFGNVTVDADSTYESLLAGDTTCHQKLDTAAYWAPALFVDGEKVDPYVAIAYYRPGALVDPATVQPYPPGLLIVAGDSTATSPQPVSVAAWHCGSSPVLTAEPPDCPPTATLAMRVAFPDCWDGENLDAPDHQSHMATSRAGRCPGSHPVPVPELVFDIRYPVHGANRNVFLASGSTYSAHADFMNAWDQEKLETEVRVCLNADRICGVVSGRATG